MSGYQLVDMIKDCIERLMQMNATKKMTIVSHATTTVFQPSLHVTKETPLSSFRALERKLGRVDTPPSEES
jgi:hypothetical protein